MVAKAQRTVVRLLRNFLLLLLLLFNVGVRSRNGIYDGQSGTAWLEPEAIYVQEAPVVEEWRSDG